MPSIFVVPIDPETANPLLPPFTCETKDGVQLHWDFDGNGNPRRGGFSRIGDTPPTTKVPTQLMWLDVSPEVIAAMKADPTYLWVQDIEEVKDAE